MPQITLRMLRAKENISKEEAGKRVGVTRQTWASWEDQKTFPDIKKVKEIEEAFGVRYDDILFFNVNHGKTVKT